MEMEDSSSWPPDQRGYNRSSKPTGVDSYHNGLLQQDIIALMDALDWGSEEEDKKKKKKKKAHVHLVGHDWGGAIAWALAANHTDRFATLTILNMPHPTGLIEGIRNGTAQAAASTYMLTFVNPSSTATLTADNDAGLKAIFAGEAFWDRDAAAYIDGWQQPNAVDSGLNWYRANIIPKAPLWCVWTACWNQGGFVC